MSAWYLPDLSSIMRSSIVQSSACANFCTVLALQFAISLFPEQMSKIVVFGTPLSCDKRYFEICFSFNRACKSMIYTSAFIISVRRLFVKQRKRGADAPPHPIHSSGSTLLTRYCEPPARTSKCRCGPVVFPVLPDSAISCPCVTVSPTDTSSSEQCAYNV